MKKQIIVTILALTASVALALDEAAKGTLTWVGSSSGGTWETADNWSASDTSLSVDELLKTNCNYDISALATGAVITNNMTDRPICNVVFSPKTTASVSLTGKSSLWRGLTRITVNSSSKLIWKMDHANNWNRKDGNKKVIIDGNGTLTLNPPTDMSFYQREIQPCSSSTLELASCCYLRLAYIRQWNNSTVRLLGDVPVAQIVTTHAGCSIDLNGHTLTIGGGENVYVAKDDFVGSDYYMGPITGPGNIKVSGGQAYPISSKMDFSGYLALYTSSLVFPKDYAFSPTVEPVVNGTGYFRFVNDATLCGLRGDGVTGGVRMADGTALTLAKGSSESAVFAGRIAGDRVVKRGADFEQVLTGDNVWTGSTTVAEGTLTLRRPIVRKGLVAYWPFDDANEPGRDYGPLGLNMSLSSINNAVATGCVSEITHRGAIDLSSNASGAGSAYYSCSGMTRAAGFPTGNDPVSISLWAKPRKSGDMMYVYRHGSWGDDGKQMTLWFKGDTVITCVNNWIVKDSDNSPAYTAGDLYDGNWHHFAITYAERCLSVYYDGVLKKQKTITCNMGIPTGTTVVLGNNDGNNNATHHYFGGIDEVYIYNRELTADEVTAEYERRFPCVEDPATLLPEALCHWSFDDASAPGKDSMGNADLIANTNVGNSVSTKTDDNAYGRCLAANASLMLPATSFPPAFPSGKDAFTVSVRFLPQSAIENYDVLHFGDISTSTNGFQLYYTSCPRQLSLIYGGTKVKCGMTNNNSTQKPAWTHAVIVCDPKKRLLRTYRDGRLEATYTDVSENTFIRLQDLCLNSKQGGKITTNVLLDDVRIYAVPLTTEQVVTLSRSLKTGSVGQIISKASPVTIDAGATLKVEGDGHRLTSLAGNGTVDLRGPSRLHVENMANFTGSVKGYGSLVVSSALGDVSVSSGVELASNVTFKAASLPIAVTTGAVKIPAEGNIFFDQQPTTKAEFIIAQGSCIDIPENAKWTTSLDPAYYTAKFIVKNNAFVLKVVPRGFLMILR